MDHTGKIVIAFQFQNANEFSEGMALVQLWQNGFGYIDLTGKLAIELHHKGRASNFSEGLAAVWDMDTNK
ncbi:MAG TPA: WG repeat-containing protein [Aggregatilineales bacterium]|nr:WG repeat-containing protein [Aggregatilineales bacterium]